MDSIGTPTAASDDALLVDGVEEANNAGILAAVKDDAGALGYVSLSGVNDDVKALGIKGQGQTSYVKPSVATVLDGTYAMARNFNFMMRDEYYESDGTFKG